MSKQYSAIDRNVLLATDNEATLDWARQKEIEPLIRDYRYLQYDMMFGKRWSARDFFPETINRLVAHTS